MTKLLERALAEISELSEDEQNTAAAILLDELAEEAKWNASFARSRDFLAKLAAQARIQAEAGETEPIEKLFGE